MNNKYYISARDYRIACDKAEQLGLKKNEWEYISERDYINRNSRIRCVFNANPNNLIGSFTKEEIQYMTRMYRD